MKTYGERLQYALNKSGLTQSQLAEICDINRSNITNYIKNIYAPKSVLNEKIAAVLNVSPSWLFLGVGNEIANDISEITLFYDGSDPTKQEIAELTKKVLKLTNDGDAYLSSLKSILSAMYENNKHKEE